MSRDNSHVSRRSALRTTSAIAAASIAGCLSDADNSSTSGNNDGESGDQDTLQQVDVDGTSLAVELSDDPDADQVNLIQPDGKLFGARDVATGVQRLSFDIGTTYAPGEYRIVAVNGDETVAETLITIQPDLRIVDWGIGRNQPEKMWDSSSDEITDEAFVTVENQGSGPDAITKLLFLGDVPTPSDEQGTNYADQGDISGIYDPESDTEVDEVFLADGEKKTIYSSRSPFAFVSGGNIQCEEKVQNGEFDLVLRTRVAADQIVKSHDVQYSPSEQWNDCEITISEA